MKQKKEDKKPGMTGRYGGNFTKLNNIGFYKCVWCNDLLINFWFSMCFIEFVKIS